MSMTHANPDPLHPPAAQRSLFRRLGPIGPVAVISMTLPAVMGLLLVWASVKYDDTLRGFVYHHHTLALALYVLGFALLAGLPVLPTYSVSFLGGYIFGLKWGVAASLTGYLGAAMVSYLFLHALSGDHVEHVLADHPKWKAVRDELLVRSTGRTLLLVALLRVPPNLPFAVVNLVLVTARVSAPVYFAGTLLGVVPRTLAVVYIAATASKLDFSAGGFWFYVGGIGAMIAVLAVISAMAHRAIRQITAANAPGSPVVENHGRPD